jgi:ribosome-binding factor A
MSHRAEQIVSVLQRGVQAVIGRGLHDPRVRGLISVTKVIIDDDLSQATIFISVLPQEHGALTLHGLRHAAPRIRSEIGRGVRMRRLPRLRFQLDDSIKKQAVFEQALKEQEDES